MKREEDLLTREKADRSHHYVVRLFTETHGNLVDKGIFKGQGFARSGRKIQDGDYQLVGSEFLSSFTGINGTHSSPPPAVLEEIFTIYLW